MTSCNAKVLSGVYGIEGIIPLVPSTNCKLPPVSITNLPAFDK